MFQVYWPLKQIYSPTTYLWCNEELKLIISYNFPSVINSYIKVFPLFCIPIPWSADFYP